MAHDGVMITPADRGRDRRGGKEASVDGCRARADGEAMIALQLSLSGWRVVARFCS